jgi:TolB protein
VKSILLRFLPAFFLVIPSLAVLHAQVQVVVGALPTVGISLGGGSAAMAAQVLANDLRHTGMLLPSTTAGQYVATGTADAGAVSGTLTDKRSGQTLFSQTFSGGRAGVHEFADAITKAITGLPGFASSKLAFVSGKELWYGDIDGYGCRPITHDGVICASPALSRDGSHLAYTSYKSGYPDVYVIDLSTGARNRIAYFPGINSGPSFSPSGDTLALTLSKDGNPEIYTIPVGGGDPTRITSTRGSETSPSWSPDGSQLVFCSDDHGSPQLYISTSGGIGEWDHLVTGNSYCTKPDWSSDGKLVAFTTRIGGVFQIGVYDLASRTARLITSAGGENPAWTRDSRHLIYNNGSTLEILDTVTGKTFAVPVPAGGTEPTVSR